MITIALQLARGIYFRKLVYPLLFPHAEIELWKLESKEIQDLIFSF